MWDIGAVSVQVCMFAFDLMYFNGESLLQKCLRTRREILRTNFPPISNKFAYVRSLDAVSTDQDDILKFFKDATDSKCEGIMVKVLDELDAADNGSITTRRKAFPSSYEPDKRTAGWCKVKKDYASGSDSLDVIPLGAWHGSGRKAGWWSPILLGIRDPSTGSLQALSKCISGFTDQFYKDLNLRYATDGINTSQNPKEFVESALTPDSMYLKCTLDLINVSLV